MRQFRLAFIEIVCRTGSITEAEQIERRVFGSPQRCGAVQPNVNNDNNEVLPVHENRTKQLNG